MCMCKKCMIICGGLFLALGVLFLLKDLNIWNFWNIQWYTAILIVVGVGHIASGKCPDCETARAGKMPKK